MGVRLADRRLRTAQQVIDDIYELQLEDMRQLQAGVPPISEALHMGRLKYFRHYPRTGDLELFDLHRIWEHRGGQCADFAAAVAAERTLAGKPSHVVAYKSSQEGVIHVVVEDDATGSWIDPSRTAGMARSSVPFLQRVQS